MSTSSSTTFFLSISLFLLTLSLLFYSTDTYTMLARAPDSGTSITSSNQQQTRVQKLTPVQTATAEPEEENLRDFCTMTNFQNCISELWPGSTGGGGAGGSTTAPPAETGNKRQSSERRTSAEESSAEAATTSSLGDQQSQQTPLPPLTSSDLAFPTSYRELQASCTDMKERVRCLDRHSERCFTPEMMQVFGHIVTNAKQFVHDLCDNKRVQTEFLIHAKCFRNISLDEQKCGQKYRDAISIPSSGGESAAAASPDQITTAQFIEEAKLTESLPTAAKLVSAGHQAQEFQIKELIMRRSCCALQELVHCKRRHVREQCGESAAIFMRDHLPRITNPVLEQHCSAYTYGPGTCDEALYRRRVVSAGAGADGQQHLVATNPYHNPFDRGSSHLLGGKKGGESSGSNRMIRNQLSEMHHNSSSSSINCCTNIVVFFFTFTLYFALLCKGSAAPAQQL